MLFYSFFTAIVTIVIAAFLSFILIGSMEENIINAHSDFYKSFVEAIPFNYSEILSELGIQKDSDHESDDHGEEEHVDVWDHFKTDLLQTPSIMQFRIFDKGLNEKWSYVSGEREDPLPLYPSMAKMASMEEVSFHIMMRKPFYVIHYYFPIIYEGESIGLIEISDADAGMKDLLVSSRVMIINTIALGGVSLYLILFALFFQSYRKQKRAIDRLDKSQSLTIHTMSLLAELRDANTGSHIIRTSRYCKAIAVALGKEKKYGKYINRHYIEDMERSAPLHDIGKVGIPDRILNKPGKLSDEEFLMVQKHPEFGAEVLETAVKSLDFQSYFEIGYQIVLHHHENWDGSGYPNGLEGESIPLSARIMAIADVYDALRTERPYKEAFPHEKAIKIISEDSGKKFDPRLVELFIGISEEIRMISES